jgi:beta-lactamase class A
MTLHPPQPLRRRHLLALAALSPALPARARAATLDTPALNAALAALERRAGGRLGVAVLATEGRATAGHRADERFSLCSTFKLLLAGAVLQRVERGQLAADLWVPFTAADMVPHAPVTRKHLTAGGMPVLALAEATQTTSDNTAANLLLRLFDGPAGFTAWLREQGDGLTRLDRWEPEMSRVATGDVRDTSTPAQMCRTAERLLVGDALSAASRTQLQAWAEATGTGRRRLRAGLPSRWRSGDKTGTGMYPGMPDKINDVAITWPPGRAPWLLAAYYDAPVSSSKHWREQDEAVLAEVGRLVGQWDGGRA